MMFCINTGNKIFRKNKNQDLLKLLSRPPNPEKLKGIQKLTEKKTCIQMSDVTNGPFLLTLHAMKRIGFYL